jgi:hypothetical protein
MDWGVVGEAAEGTFDVRVGEEAERPAVAQPPADVAERPTVSPTVMRKA